MVRCWRLRAFHSLFPIKKLLPLSCCFFEVDSTVDYALTETFLAIHELNTDDEMGSRSSAAMAKSAAFTVQSVVQMLMYRPWEESRRQAPKWCYKFHGADAHPHLNRILHAYEDLRGKHVQVIWERTHWIPKQRVRVLVERFGQEFPIEWEEYCEERQRCYCAMRARVVTLYTQALLLIQEGLMRPEVLLDPSIPCYAKGVYWWVPDTLGWVQSLQELDHREPWRAWWWGSPELHPYNTILCARRNHMPVFRDSATARSRVESRGKKKQSPIAAAIRV